MRSLMDIEQVEDPVEEIWCGRLIGIGHQTFNLDNAGSSPVRTTF
jgi:hypothetical protein